jgi:catalase
MKPAKADPTTAVAEDLLQAFDALNGPQPGFRPAHAKGILLSGTFTPSPDAVKLTRAPHAERSSTKVGVRFSDFAGVPNIPDNDPNASPRGFAIRFHLAEHVHTDIIGHSVDGFPAHTAEEFGQLLRAIAASGPNAPKPTPIEQFLGSHPAALAFVQTPKPFPVSFATESYFSATAYKFINREGLETYGRYRIRPESDAAYLDDAAAAKKSANYLFDEIAQRLGKGGIRMRIAVQLAAPGDPVNDSTVHWPKDRRDADFGTFEVSEIVPENDAEQRHIIFDPIPRVDGIEPSDDPLLDVRANLYLMSGRRRRAQGGK